MVTLARRRKVLPKESFIATVESIDHEGRGIAHLDGKTIFISGAIAGEVVECMYTRSYNRYDEARVINVIEVSPNRVEPRCEHVSFCGGCSLQHINAAAQLASKQATLLEQLTHFGNTQPENILPAITGPSYEYRRKARLGVRYVHKKQKVLVGFRERSGRYLADITTCPILLPPVNRLMLPLSQLIGALSVNETVPQIEVAISDDITALVFRHITDLTQTDQQLFVEFAKNYNIHVYLQPGGLNSVHRLYPKPTGNEFDELLAYQLKKYDLTLHFHPCDFVQVNPAVNEKMIDQVIALLELTPEDNVLDLFSGLGNLSLPIAKQARSVCAVEGVEAMVKRAGMNAQHNGITNFTSVLANLTKPLQSQSWFEGDFNKIVLDPPRSGATEILPDLIAKRPTHIIYVSCDPATLARDAGELTHYGYRLANVGVIDMFAQTTHVESIAQFILKE